jgi:hypothetical protein
MTAPNALQQAEPQLTISFVGDLATAPTEDVLVVEQHTDYVRACRAIAKAAVSGAGLRIWVRSRPHQTWLQRFVEQIGLSASFREMTPRLVLAERWHVTLPDWLDDEMVLQNGLLGLDIGLQDHRRMGPRGSFADRLLVHMLGSAFQSDVLGADNLSDVLKVLTGDRARRAFRDIPVLARCLTDKCERWTAHSGEPWVPATCQLLQEDAGALWQWLSLWACLHSYPDRLLDYVLTPRQAQFVRRVPVDAVVELPLEPAAREDALVQIEALIEGGRDEVTSGETFRKIVGWASGRLIGEYRLVTDLLRDGSFSPTDEDIRAVRAKFRLCPGVSESEMKALDHLIRPPQPSLLGADEARTWQEWVQWTIHEYVPYRDWQVRNAQYEAPLEDVVARFSDWYLDEYATIHADPGLSLAHSLNDLAPSISEASLTMVLLIDCLPVSFMALMDDALRNIGFNRHTLQYRFAALPTDTEHNKPVLLSGRWQTGGHGYPAILDERAAADWEGRHVIYAGSLKALSELTAPQADTIIVLNFIEGDRVLHSDVEAINSTYEEELYRLFGRVAEAVSGRIEAWALSREQVSIHVVTDHGACRILEEEKRSLDSAVVSKLFPDEKHRYAAVDEEQRDTVPESLWELGHSFQPPFTPDDRIYFLPKGHNTVRRSNRNQGYMHGGVTPEEVIVPMATYRLVQVEWTPPAARFLELRLNAESGRAEFYIQRIEPLWIEIQNTNAVDIEILRASVTAPDTDVKDSEVATILAGGMGKVSMDCYFRKAALDADLLEIEIVYELAGEQHTMSLALECEFKSAMPQRLNLRDL